jgi:carboxypeptidase Taq
MGAVAASQLFRAATTSDPEVRPALARGDFAPLLRFVRAHVHALGSRYTTSEVLARATGKSLDAETFLDHLRARYLA